MVDVQRPSFFSLRVSCMWVPSTDEVLSPSYYNPLVVGCLQVTSTDYVQATVVPRWRWRVHKIMNTLIGHARFGSRRFSFFFPQTDSEFLMKETSNPVFILHVQHYSKIKLNLTGRNCLFFSLSLSLIWNSNLLIEWNLIIPSQ